MRCVAKVSNCTPCAASKRVSASDRPIMPTWIRSSSSTLAGSLAIIWCASRRTSGLYCLSIALASRRPLAVYMVMGSGQVSSMRRRRAARAAAGRAAVQRRQARPAVGRRRRGAAARATRRAQRRSSARGARRRRVDGAQSRSARRESGRRRWSSWSAMRSARGDCGATRQQQVEDHQPRSAAPAASSRRRHGSRWRAGAGQQHRPQRARAREHARQVARRRAPAPRRPAARRWPDGVQEGAGEPRVST